MLQPRAKERRRAPRYPCERLARIQGSPPLPCLITDFSDGGVRIKTIGFRVRGAVYPWDCLAIRGTNPRRLSMNVG